MMTEDLFGMPLHDEIRGALRAMIRRGLDPLDVAEAAQVVASALSISIKCEARAGAKLYAAGLALMESTKKRDSA